MKLAKLLNIKDLKERLNLYLTKIDYIISKRASCFAYLKYHLAHKNGLEIGGPSKIFQKQELIPLYSILDKIDQCNFSKQNIWQKDHKQLKHIIQKGHQYICEASNLSEIKSEKYDFILASHCIEHIANPIKALKEWLRLIKPNGHLLIIVPNKEFTFDQNRPITLLSHIIKDFEDKIDETDLTHLEDILSLHDLTKDPLAGSYEEFKKRSSKNYENRCLHHHVFNSQLLTDLFSYLNVKIISIEIQRPHHIITVIQKIV